MTSNHLTIPSLCSLLHFFNNWVSPSPCRTCVFLTWQKSNLSKSLSKHFLLHSVKGLFIFSRHGTIFCPVEDYRAHNCLIRFCVEWFEHLFITYNARYLHPLETCSLYTKFQLYEIATHHQISQHIICLIFSIFRHTKFSYFFPLFNHLSMYTLQCIHILMHTFQWSLYSVMSHQFIL